LGARDWEDHSLRPGQSGQKVSETPISVKKLVVVVYTCDPRYAGGKGRMIVVKTCLGKNVRSYQKNSHSKKKKK
jgi:hypothetical protein